MSLKIYNEKEEDVDPDTIGENTQVITIMEIQGIKCSARSFQIEIELKQMMVLEPVDLFETCILGKGKSKLPVSTPVQENGDNLEVEPDKKENDTAPQEEEEQKDSPIQEADLPLEEILDPSSIDVLQEYDLEQDLAKVEEEDTVQIKERKEVYYKMYKEAREKAKQARAIALSAYLEAKQIKATYSLTTDDSDSDNDNEPDTT
jgi:hypothetical protein